VVLRLRNSLGGVGRERALILSSAMPRELVRAASRTATPPAVVKFRGSLSFGCLPLLIVAQCMVFVADGADTRTDGVEIIVGLVDDVGDITDSFAGDRQ
jgi:hypothetical protein